MSKHIKEPCEPETTGKKRPDWCVAHGQSIWDCMKLYRGNVKRAKELMAEKERLLKEIHKIDKTLRLSTTTN